MTFFDLLIALAKHKKKLLLFPLIASLAALAISFTLPDIYSANTRLLPPQQPQSSASALLAQLGGIASATAGAAGIKNPNDVYIGMLKSRTVADRLIARFGLMEAYGTTSQESARDALGAKTTITAGKDGLVVIEVEDLDRTRVAAITNAYVDELVRLTKNLAVTEAAQRRLFFEQQLEQAKENLAKAEESLKKGIDQRGMVSVDAESAAFVATASRLKAQLTAKEIELNSMSSFVTSSNPEYLRVAAELSSLRAQLTKLAAGRNGDSASAQGGLENVKILRDVKYYQMLYELLAKQFEAARLDEAKESAVIQVLDKALAPERRARPKRALILVLGGVLGLFAALSWIFFVEVKRRISQAPDTAEKLAELSSLLRWR